MKGLKKVYFMTLELLGGFEEMTLFLTPCDEKNPLFVPNSSLFLEKQDGPRLCPISLVRLGLETCVRRLLLHTGPYAGVQECKGDDEITLQEGNFVTLKNYKKIVV